MRQILRHSAQRVPGDEASAEESAEEGKMASRLHQRMAQRLSRMTNEAAGWNIRAEGARTCRYRNSPMSWSAAAVPVVCAYCQVWPGNQDMSAGRSRAASGALVLSCAPCPAGLGKALQPAPSPNALPPECKSIPGGPAKPLRLHVEKCDDMQDKARHRSSRLQTPWQTSDAGSAGKADAKRSKPMSAEAEPSTPTKRAKS